MGNEYWQTFETQTPGWTLYGDRYWIRECFQDFQECYSGARPTGIWAEHFSIICWPITHAILPRDLQRQLAHILYNLRYTLTPQILESPRQLGELIAEQRWKASSRFQQLAGEPLFLGQIAAALLLRGNDYTSKLIHPSTLARVSADVDRERHARTWLRGAREKAQRQVQFRKIRGQVVQQGDSVDDTALETVSTITTKTEPRVVLRPLQDDKWEILIELPDFSLAPSRLSQFTEVIANNRCHVTGSSGRPLT